ncbi:MAG: rhomboid family intramembrane serine protease [Actinomycetota bacterium]
MPEDQLPAPPPAPTVEVCYRHPQTETRVHCTRCERPICPDCMIPAPVGFQCPECVQQARREFRQGPGRALRVGGVTATKALLVAIGAMFVLEVLSGGPRAMFEGPNQNQLIDLGALQPFLIADGQFWRLFSAMFLHAGLLHIGFNAYALWLFGAMIESNLGRTRMLLIYFTTGFLASVTSYAFGDVGVVGVGASGAIFGIFGAFIAYNYRRRHLAMAAANLRWASTLLLLNLLLAFGFGGRIDWRAHVGGLVAGLAAGAVAEGWGSASQRRVILVAGFAGLVAAGVALTVWRTNEIRGMFPQFFGG